MGLMQWYSQADSQTLYFFKNSLSNLKLTTIGLGRQPNPWLIYEGLVNEVCEYPNTASCCPCKKYLLIIVHDLSWCYTKAAEIIIIQNLKMNKSFTF